MLSDQEIVGLRRQLSLQQKLKASVTLMPQQLAGLLDELDELKYENTQLIGATRPFINAYKIYNDLPEGQDPTVDLAGMKCLPIPVDDIRGLERVHEIILQTMAQRGTLKAKLAERFKKKNGSLSKRNVSSVKILERKTKKKV